MANSRPVTSTMSVNAFCTEVASRYTQASAMISTPTMTLAATGVENREDTLPRKLGSTRWLAIP